MLPFIKPPAAKTLRRIGTDSSGILELEVRGGLTVGESATISELLANQQSNFVKGAQIADAIAKEESLSLTEAFQIIESAISNRTLEPAADLIRVKHAARIQEVAIVYAQAGQRNMEATVTALIRSRCSLPDWSLDDTRDLDKALFSAIWQLAQDEQATENMPVNRPSEDDLKKPQLVTPKRKARTGPQSSGN